jgi:hypothetical protein
MSRDRDEFRRRTIPSLRDLIARRSGRFVEIPGYEMAFTIDRKRLDAATFSKEALDGLCDQVRAYVWSRVWMAYKDGDWKVPPKHLTVLVTVSIDSEAHPTNGEGPALNPDEWTGRG